LKFLVESTTHRKMIVKIFCKEAWTQKAVMVDPGLTIILKQLSNDTRFCFRHCTNLGVNFNITDEFCRSNLKNNRITRIS
ncbi:Hypothetical predicted protein, partial [Mytilus galloprovincialis]